MQEGPGTLLQNRLMRCIAKYFLTLTNRSTLKKSFSEVSPQNEEETGIERQFLWASSKRKTGVEHGWNTHYIAGCTAPGERKSCHVVRQLPKTRMPPQELVRPHRVGERKTPVVRPDVHDLGLNLGGR